MARNRKHRDRDKHKEPPHKSSPTGALLQKLIYQPQYNEWIVYAHVDDNTEDCNFLHPVNFKLLRAKREIKIKKGEGKGGHKRLPQRVIQALSGQSQTAQ